MVSQPVSGGSSDSKSKVLSVLPPPSDQMPEESWAENTLTYTSNWEGLCLFYGNRFCQLLHSYG